MFSRVNGCHVVTRIFKKEYNFQWTVKSFSKFPLGKITKTAAFFIQPDQEFYATLELIEDETTDLIETNVSTTDLMCFLTFHKLSGPDIEIRHTVSIRNCAGKVVFENVRCHTYTDNSLEFDVMPECSAVIKEARKEDVLVLNCVMEYNEEIENDMYHTKIYPKKELVSCDVSALLDDLKAMHNTSQYADVGLIVGDSVLRVHKAFVCARSLVLARIFETPMGESEKNEVVITDLEVSVLKDLVAYMYTGVVKNEDFESVYALYYAADKYDVSCLRNTCSDILVSQLDTLNACRVLAMADRHSHDEFKDSVIDFIKCHFEEMQETEAWDDLVAPIASDVIARCRSKLIMSKPNTS